VSHASNQSTFSLLFNGSRGHSILHVGNTNLLMGWFLAVKSH